jgi:hypothetical protein
MQSRITEAPFMDWITSFNFGCWGACFWWMHRISVRQNAVLSELTTQARRIEEISRQEHALLTEVHPNVEQIKKGVDEVSEKVAHATAENSSSRQQLG